MIYSVDLGMEFGFEKSTLQLKKLGKEEPWKEQNC